MTDLYRVFDADDQLLYVGITEDVDRRMANHQIHSGWFDQAERLRVEWHRDRASALAAERDAIRRERPLWNLQLSTDREAAQQLRAPLLPRWAANPTAAGPETQAEQFIARARRRFRLLRTADRRRKAA